MHIWAAVTLFATSLIYIGLRAFQQQNVTHERYWWVPPTTMLMAVCEVAQLTTIIKQQTYAAAVPMALGGVLGCWLSMWLHRRMRRGK